MKQLISLLLLVGALSRADASFSFDFPASMIPDASFVGTSASATLNLPGQTITDVTVDLTISGVGGADTFLGDLYVYITDGTNLVTLLNRPGRSGDLPDGYDDRFGLDVTFTDSATIDAHEYRPVLTGSNATPLPGELLGLLQPDGRITSPTSVLTGDARSSAFADFVGLSADRTFTLFAADLSGGVAHQIDAWRLEVSTVPEPSQASLVLAIGAWVLCRRRHSVSGVARSFSKR